MDYGLLVILNIIKSLLKRKEGIVLWHLGGHR